MLDKVSGRACYAIMSFGGFLDIGNRPWPLPWSALTYDKSKEGFVVDVEEEVPADGGIQCHRAEVHEPVVVAAEHLCDLAVRPRPNSSPLRRQNPP
jgi:hypothetical protein